MTTEIGILAVIGGDLAFKAKTYGGIFYTRLLADGSGACQGYYLGKISTDFRAVTYHTRGTNKVANCIGVPSCNTST